MSKIKIDSKITFEDKTFNEVPIEQKTNRQDGFNAPQTFKLYVDENEGTLLVVGNDDEVLLKAMIEGFTPVDLD